MIDIVQHSFFKIADSKVEADDLAYGLETYQSGRLFLDFSLNDVITQYLWLPTVFEVTSVKLVDSNTNKSLSCSINFLQLTPFTKLLVVSFKANEVGCQRLLINDIYYSNVFKVSSTANQYTSIISYWNETSIYTMDYEGIKDVNPFSNDYVPQQIRLPIWYVIGKVDSKAKEVVFDRGKPTTKIIYAPELDYVSVYKCAFNNWSALRFSSLASSDNVYIDFKKVTPVSFEPEEPDDGADFSISEWETQFIYKDNELIELEYNRKIGILNYHYNQEHYAPEHYSTETI